MLTSIVVSIVKACTRFALPTVLIALILAVAAGFYTARNFAINTDINTLISPDLDWRQRDNQFEKAFDRERIILAVVEAPTPELASTAADALAQKLSGDTEHFESVQPLGSGEFFEKNGLLFLPAEEVAKMTGQFASAAPLIEIMAGDPSMRGLTGALETGLAGVKRGQVKLDSTERPFSLIAQTVENVLNKGSATFSWRELVSDKPLTDSDRRAFIEFKPILDFNALEPGKDATDAIRQAANDLNLAGEYRRARPADRAGSDRQRRIRDRSGRRHRQRHRHRAGGAGDSLDGAAFVEDHLRRVRQPVHRAFDHHRGRPDDGGLAEPAVDRIRRAVRRAWASISASSTASATARSVSRTTI